MLFVESKTINHSVSHAARIQLLEKLQELGRAPLIRTTRLNCFDQLLLGTERTREMERALANWNESHHQPPYVQGDLFCLSDHVLFLVFNREEQSCPAVKAGIVYDSNTPEPFRKLEMFCREVRQLLPDEVFNQGSEGSIPDWEPGKPVMPEGFKRFVARQDNDLLFTNLRKDTMTRRTLAASRLEDENARVFLRTAREAHDEGYAAKLLTGNTADSYSFSIERLEAAGLVEREVQVSCRKTGHALLRLPNANALVVVTVSDATCSECGASIADEKVEEVIAPTRLASSLLEDGSWLVSRLHSLLRELGVPESEIAVAPSEGDGYGQMMANISGESFLLVVRDGDLSPAFARWAIDLEIETDASHLVVVATGKIHNQANLLLLNHSRRRIASGRDFELVLADGPSTASRELRNAFDRVSERVVAEQLCDLDSSLGLSTTRLVMSKFDMLRSSERMENHGVSSESISAASFVEPRNLALTAGASWEGGDIIDIGEWPPNDFRRDSESASAEDADSQLLSEFITLGNEFQTP